MDRRETLTEVFRDTQAFYAENTILAKAVEASKRATELIGAEEQPALPATGRENRRKVVVTPMRTFEAAMRLHGEFPNKKIGALNFMGIFLWRQDGGTSTLTDFHKLTVPERQEIVDWLREMELYREIEVGGETYVLVHAGLGQNADPARTLDDYDLNDYLFERPNYDKICYPDKYIVSGHTPTRLIPGNLNPDRIYRANRHIAIDCGCVFGGKLGAICLDTGEEFYI